MSEFDGQDLLLLNSRGVMTCSGYGMGLVRDAALDEQEMNLLYDLDFESLFPMLASYVNASNAAQTLIHSIGGHHREHPSTSAVKP